MTEYWELSGRVVVPKFLSLIQIQIQIIFLHSKQCEFNLVNMNIIVTDWSDDLIKLFLYSYFCFIVDNATFCYDMKF